MHKFTLLLFLGIMAISSCQSIDDEILPAVGIYRAHVLGVAGPFDLIISTDHDDDVIIEALFDGDEYFTVNADLDIVTDSKLEIDIKNQQIAVGKHLSGTGFILNGTLEIRYTLDCDGRKTNYKIVGTKI